MNLWGGRFTKPTDQLVYDFNASISFDQTFIPRYMKYCSCQNASKTRDFNKC